MTFRSFCANVDEETHSYPHLPVERLEYWQQRAFREWAFRPGPALTFLKSMNSREGIKSAFSIAFQHFGWMGGTDSVG